MFNHALLLLIMYSVFIHSAPSLRLIIHSDGQLIVKTELKFEKKGFFVDFVNRPSQKLEELVIQNAKNYALGKSVHPKLPCQSLPLPPFTTKVIESLLKIPKGKTWSYQEMARFLGSPQAARAVGNACAANPFPWIYPCHRVVASDGTIGKFAFGTAMKKQLLDFEKN